MQRCHECSRHLFERESRCPFCAAALRPTVGAAPVMIAALVGLSLAACNGETAGTETTTATTSGSMSGTSAGTDSMSSTNNPPTTTSPEMTGSSTVAPTSSDTSATSMTSTTSSSTSDTSATTDPDTSTSSSGTTSTSGSESSSTGQTSGSDTGTTLMTTGGDCTGPGEEICGGVCVNTLTDYDHCGGCFESCDDKPGFYCEQGECIVVLPYGAPMPDPLWV